VVSRRTPGARFTVILRGTRRDMRAQLISPVVSPVVKVVTLPPRLAGRVGGVVVGQVLGTARLVAGELRDLLGRNDGRDLAVGPAAAGTTERARLVEPRAAEPTDRPMEGVVDSIVEAIEEATPDGPPVSHGDLPLEDYDHLTIGQLRSRIRSLPLEDLGQLQAYEVAHANRLPVLAVLTNRLRDLESKARAGAGQ